MNDFTENDSESVCCYNEDISRMINMDNSESYIDLLFFLIIIVLQQKKIERLKEPCNKKDITLLDFMAK